jgi:hypothetical protein
MHEADKLDPDYGEGEVELAPRPPPPKMLQHLKTVSSTESQQMHIRVPEIVKKTRQTAPPSNQIYFGLDPQFSTVERPQRGTRTKSIDDD